jgi:molybdenum cofactor cytidylyltransferase
MNLLHALRLDPFQNPAPAISLVGAGGKTTALFQLARQYLAAKYKRVFVTASTHLGEWQILNADHHVIYKDMATLIVELNDQNGVILITGEIAGNKTLPLQESTLIWLREKQKEWNIPLLIEADGARERSLKAPAAHEPPIPEFSDMVIHVSGLGVIGKPLNDENVHHAEIFSRHARLAMEAPVTAESIVSMLRDPEAGLKNIPASAHRIAFLNQADSPILESIGGGMAHELLDTFDSIVVGSLKEESFQTFEHTAAIILAAGSSTRYGAPKQLLDWKGKPFVRHIAETALQSGLWPVVVVTGAHHAEIKSSLKELPVQVVHNENHAQGQGISIKAGLQTLSLKVGACIFLLADQPQIPAEVIRALVESHSRELQPILAPLVLEERRANPVLFDKVTFPDLLKLEGDVGGRAIFSNYKVEYLPWHDDILLLDVDKPEDYKRLIEDETSGGIS